MRSSAPLQEVSRFGNAISTYGDHLVFVFGVPDPGQQKIYCESLTLLLDALSETEVKVIALNRRPNLPLAEFAKQSADRCAHLVQTLPRPEAP